MEPTEDRQVFQYHDGSQAVWGDPLAIESRLVQATGGNPEGLAKACNNKGDPVTQATARQQMAQAVRYAFEMQPFDRATGQGATDDDCLKALAAYAAFLEKKNPSGANGQTWPPSTEPESLPSAEPLTSVSGPTWDDSEP